MQRKSISSFEAKTKLSEVLREAEKGQEFIVTNRGKPIAKIVPIEKISISEWDLFINAATKIKKQQKGKISIKSLIDEGRKY
jgi:prevent-host-death family protein